MAIFKILFVCKLIGLILGQKIICNFLVFFRNLKDEYRVAVGPDIARWSFCVSAVARVTDTGKTTRHGNFSHFFITVLEFFKEQTDIIGACHTEKTASRAKQDNQIFPTDILILLQSVNFNILYVRCCWELYQRRINGLENLFPYVDFIQRQAAIISRYDNLTSRSLAVRIVKTQTTDVHTSNLGKVSDLDISIVNVAVLATLRADDTVETTGVKIDILDARLPFFSSS